MFGAAAGMMLNGRDKEESRRRRALLRELLLREWDPIGIAAFPEAADEYDRYADAAYVMVIYDSATADAVCAYLLAVATEAMEFPADPDLVSACRRVAQRFVEVCRQDGPVGSAPDTP